MRWPGACSSRRVGLTDDHRRWPGERSSRGTTCIHATMIRYVPLLSLVRSSVPREVYNFTGVLGIARPASRSWPAFPLVDSLRRSFVPSARVGARSPFHPALPPASSPSRFGAWCSTLRRPCFGVLGVVTGLSLAPPVVGFIAGRVDLHPSPAGPSFSLGASDCLEVPLPCLASGLRMVWKHVPPLLQPVLLLVWERPRGPGVSGNMPPFRGSGLQFVWKHAILLRTSELQIARKPAAPFRASGRRIVWVHVPPILHLVLPLVRMALLAAPSVWGAPSRGAINSRLHPRSWSPRG